MGNILTIIFIILMVVWPAIVKIMQAADKKRQELRMREEAEKHRRQQAGHQISRPDDTSTGSRHPGSRVGRLDRRGQPTPSQSRAGKSRLEDLQARRREQLDELRQRRQQQRSTQPTPVARTGATSNAPTAPPSQKPPPAQRPYGPAPVPTTRQPQPSARQRQQQQREQQMLEAHERRERARRQAEEARKKRDQLKRQQALTPGDASGEPLLKPLSKPTAALTSSSLLTSLRSGQVSRATLRDLIIAKEILDPPLALRE